MDRDDVRSSQIHGVTTERFALVRESFAASLEDLGGGGAAFAVWADDELVVDLWAGSAGSHGWQARTRAVLMSVTKGIAAVVIAQLVDEELVDLDAPVARYWPEFASGGKDNLLVRHVLTHSAGLISVPNHADLLGPRGEGWGRYDELCRRLANATPEWEPGSAFGYHGITFGWLVDAVVRGATGITIGSHLRERIAGPWGLELDLGTHRSTQTLVAHPVLSARLREEVEALTADPTSMAARAYFTKHGSNVLTDINEYCRNPDFLEREMPALNATGTARAVATLYGRLVCPGPHRQLVSPATLSEFTKEHITGFDLIDGKPDSRALGFARRPASTLGRSPDYADWGPGLRTFGHHGFGGQIAFADPDAGVGVAMVRTLLSSTPGLGRELVRATYECL